MSIRRATWDDVLEQCRSLARQVERYRPEEMRIAAFDADGTLWGPDVADLLWDRLLSERALTEAAGPPLSRILRTCGTEPARDPYADMQRLREMHRAGRCSEETRARAMLQGLAGLREEAVYDYALMSIAAAEELRGLEHSEPARSIRQMRSLGFRVIVASGSPRWAVEAAVRPLGIEAHDVIAGTVAVVEGRLTDGIIEPLPLGKGKIRAILDRFGRVPCIALGNGMGDLAMIEASSHLKLLVNPTNDLIEACEAVGGSAWSMGILELPPSEPRAGRARPRG